MQTHGSISAFARVLIALTLLLAPLAFGAVQPWAWGTIAIAAVCVLLLWTADCVRVGAATFVWSPLYVPALVVLVICAFQLTFGLTLDSYETREAAIKLIAAVIIFFVVQQLFAETSPRAWRLIGAAITIYAFAMALFAIVQFFATPGLIYGVIKPRWGGYIFGPYVYHNAYAGLMEMLIPISAAYIMSQTIAPELTLDRSDLAPLAAQKAALNVGRESSQWRTIALLFSLLISVVSVFLSASRGGVLVLAIEFAIFAAIILGTGARSGRGKLVTGGWKVRALLAGCCVLFAAGVFFVWLDPGSVWTRWQQAASSPEMATGERDRISLDTLRMSGRYLGSGIGLGAFEAGYPRYQTVTTDLTINFAHNDYAQFFAEVGILGWVVAPVCVALMLFLCFSGLRARLYSQLGWFKLGAAVGVCGILVHSLWDFNLHIPANAAWFVTCAAVVSLPDRVRHSSGLMVIDGGSSMTR